MKRGFVIGPAILLIIILLRAWFGSPGKHYREERDHDGAGQQRQSAMERSLPSARNHP